MENFCLINESTVNNILRKRPEDTHKGQCGRVLVVAGSCEMTGACILCVRAAFRAGAGLVYAYVPDEVIPIIALSVPEVICIPRSRDIDAGSYDAVALGPGLGDDRNNVDLIKKILKESDKGIVIDADGLNTIAGYDLFSLVREKGDKVVVTPHPKEGERLLGRKIKDRGEAVLRLSEKMQSVAVLKGAGTLVAMSGKEAYINTTGNPGMATAGAGDVLTGIVASLMAQGYDSFDSALCGVYIHGLAGDLAAAAKGQWGIMASDIAEFTSPAIKEITGW